MGDAEGRIKGLEPEASRRAPNDSGACCRGAGCSSAGLDGAGRHGGDQHPPPTMAEIARARGTPAAGPPCRMGAAPIGPRGPFRPWAPAPKALGKLKAPVISFTHAAGVAKRLRQRLVVPPFGGSIPLARPVATTATPGSPRGGFLLALRPPWLDPGRQRRRAPSTGGGPALPQGAQERLSPLPHRVVAGQAREGGHRLQGGRGLIGR